MTEDEEMIELRCQAARGVKPYLIPLPLPGESMELHNGFFRIKRVPWYKRLINRLKELLHVSG